MISHLLLLIATVLSSAMQADDQSRTPSGQTRPTVFGVEGEGDKFVYVFDRSASMSENGGLPLRAAKNELLKSLEALERTQQFQIIFYNERPKIFALYGQPGRLALGSDSVKDHARRFVNSVTAQGGTNHEDALATALRMAPDVVFFLTDGTDPAMSDAELGRIKRMNGGLAAVHVIEFGPGARPAADSFLVRLARENRGKYVYVDVSQLKDE
jgi:hypothetical protein